MYHKNDAQTRQRGAEAKRKDAPMDVFPETEYRQLLLSICVCTLHQYCLYLIILTIILI